MKLLWSQGFQNGIKCWVKMSKSPSRYPKSSKTPDLDVLDLHDPYDGEKNF